LLRLQERARANAASRGIDVDPFQAAASVLKAEPSVRDAAALAGCLHKFDVE
jgi:hypothetical protein